MSSIFSDDDREAWRLHSEGAEEEQRLAEQLAPEIVANILEDARNQFRTYGHVSAARGSDNSPRNEHSPYVPSTVLEKALRPVVREVFSLPDDAFTISASMMDGDFITGTYDDSYRRISVRVNFNPPLT